jgi:thiol-disulfide isomerase/thioredoxin
VGFDNALWQGSFPTRHEVHEMLNIRFSTPSAYVGLPLLAGGFALSVALCGTPGMGQEGPSGAAAGSGEQVSATEGNRGSSVTPATDESKQAAEGEPDEAAPQPCVTDRPSASPCTDQDKIPRFVVNSPFDNSPPLALKKERRLWADSWLWDEAPELVVEKWLTDKPDTKGKYVLIEFWAPWCGPCRRSIPLLNGFHKKYGEELVVIGISEENEEDTRGLNKEYPETPDVEFYSAIDTQKRMKDKLGVWGIPHVIVLEPKYRCVIWEGFPLQEGYELTDKIVEKFLAVGRKVRAEEERAAGK